MKYEALKFGLKELKFVKSPKDLRIFLGKALYLFPKAIGISHRYTEVPYSLQIEPTNHCNLDCISCASSASSRKYGYMDLALFREIIDDASKMGVKMVRLWLLGEPMLHPRIVDMIGYVKQKGLQVRLTTNGMSFDSERIESILQSGVDSGDRVIFSVLGYSKEVHERIMRGVNHSKVIKNIHDFIALRKKHRHNGPVVETIFYVMPENEMERQQFSTYWRSVVDHVRISGISKQFAEFGNATNSPRPVRKATCSHLWDRMIIFWNGDVPLCIGDVDGSYCLGNVKELSLSEIWNCEALMSLRKSHQEKRFGELPLCSSCDWY